mgnify:CR=1 FL=1
MMIGYLCGIAAKCALVAFSVASYPIAVIGLACHDFSTLFVRGGVLSAWWAGAHPLGVLGVTFALRTRLYAFLGVAAVYARIEDEECVIACVRES